MSVLIKGMELPKDCMYCKMAYYNASDEFTGCAVVPDKRYAMHNDAVYAKSTQRPDWCPLIEIPAHGRLIDADKMNDLLLKEKEKVIGSGDKLGAFAVGFAMGFIYKEPTVIEAEGSEDE